MLWYIYLTYFYCRNIPEHRTGAIATSNVLLPHEVTGLSQDSGLNVSQIFTLDKAFLTECIGLLSVSLQEEVNEGLQTVIYL